MNNHEDPPLCVNGCGFFGQPTTRNLCSKCYTDFIKHLSMKPEPEPDPVTSLTNHGEEEKMSMKNTVRVNRCGVCKKRVGLLGFECQCGGFYCGSHRYPEEHCCAVDLKARGRHALQESLISAAECKADKLPHRI